MTVFYENGQVFKCTRNTWANTKYGHVAWKFIKVLPVSWAIYYTDKYFKRWNHGKLFWNFVLFPSLWTMALQHCAWCAPFAGSHSPWLQSARCSPAPDGLHTLYFCKGICANWIELTRSGTLAVNWLVWWNIRNQWIVVRQTDQLRIALIWWIGNLHLASHFSPLLTPGYWCVMGAVRS